MQGYEDSFYEDFHDFYGTFLKNCLFYGVERAELDFFVVKLFHSSPLFSGHAEDDDHDYMLPSNWEAVA